MNPLKGKQIKDLNAIGFDDLARKVDEIVTWCNQAESRFNQVEDKETSKKLKDIKKILNIK